MVSLWANGFTGDLLYFLTVEPIIRPNSMQFRAQSGLVASGPFDSWLASIARTSPS